MPDLVVVSVGTDHHPFDRLIDWVDSFAKDNRAVRFVVQYGTSRRPEHADGSDLIAYTELCAMFAEATVVIAHGGPSTVMDARAAGRKPLVVPRNPELGEHIDGHQMLFGEHLDKHGLAVLVETEEAFNSELISALQEPQSVAVGGGEEQSAEGVAEFGRVVDGLLGVTEVTG